MTNTKKRNKLYCENCRFACQATDCECLCHTQNEGFIYGFKLGMKNKEDLMKASFQRGKQEAKKEWDEKVVNYKETIDILHRDIDELKQINREAKKEFKDKLLKLKEEIRVMPNRDDKVKARLSILDGGGVGKFEVIKKIAELEK